MNSLKKYYFSFQFKDTSQLNFWAMIHNLLCNCVPLSWIDTQKKTQPKRRLFYTLYEDFILSLSFFFAWFGMTLWSWIFLFTILFISQLIFSTYYLSVYVCKCSNTVWYMCGVCVRVKEKARAKESQRKSVVVVEAIVACIPYSV